MERERILDRESFFDLLQLEVKRARRYQNFFSLLKLKISSIPGRGNGADDGLGNCFRNLSAIVSGELRESDILGTIEKEQLAVLAPYADISALNSLASRLENSLKYYGLKERGYEVSIDLLCFPLDGTDTPDLMEKLQNQFSPLSS